MLFLVAPGHDNLHMQAPAAAYAQAVAVSTTTAALPEQSTAASSKQWGQQLYPFCLFSYCFPFKKLKTQKKLEN